MKRVVLDLIIEYEESEKLNDIAKKMIESVMSKSIKIEIGPLPLEEYLEDIYDMENNDASS